MGNQISEFFGKGDRSIIWEKFDSREFFLKVCGKEFVLNEELIQQVYENPSKGHIFALFLQKIVEKWNSDYFVSALLHLLKHFILYFTFSSSESVSFIYQKPSKILETPSQSQSTRPVPCSFTYKSCEKTLYISIPPPNSDTSAAEIQLHSTIASNFPDLSKFLSNSSKKLILLNSQDKPIQFSDIQSFYSNFDDTALVDPFAEKPYSCELMNIKIKTMSYELDSPLRDFVGFLIRNMGRIQMGVYTIRTHAVIEFFIVGLAAQLYRKKKGEGVKYRDFKYSPMVYLLMDVDREVGKAFVVALLEYCKDFSNPEKKFSYFSSFFASELDLKIAEIEEETPKLALSLLLLLDSYGFEGNPFKLINLELNLHNYFSFLRRCEKDTTVLMLFTELLTSNSGFVNEFCSMGGFEEFLNSLIGELYMAESNSIRINFILVLILKLSENSDFNQKAFRDIQLKSVVWMQEYEIKRISLGSLLLLAIVRLLRTNFSTVNLEFVQVYCVACLFNLSEFAVDIHTVTWNEFVTLLKGLHRSYIGHAKKDSDYAENYKCFVQLFLEIICKVLKNGLEKNKNAVFVMLKEKELFDKMNKSDVANENLKEIVRCLEVFWQFVEGEADQMEGVKMACHLQSFSFCEYEILTCERFAYSQDLGKWEEFAVPFIWEVIYKDMPILQKNDLHPIFNPSLELINN